EIDAADQTRRRLDQDDRIAFVLEIGRSDVREIVYDSHNANHGRWIDIAVERFVIKADVAASDGRAKSVAGLSHSIHNFAELPHHFGMFRISEVETVGRGERTSAGADNVAAGLRHHKLCAFARILRD